MEDKTNEVGEAMREVVEIDLRPTQKVKCWVQAGTAGLVIGVVASYFV